MTEVDYTTIIDPSDPRPIHFVGVTGAGMSALAELFVRRGLNVTGCDKHPTSAANDLRQLGIEVHAGHDPAHVVGAKALVVTSAMPKDHPEIVRAHELGIPVIGRAEALGMAVSGEGREVVGIAGTHGKTTTTALTTVALTAAGLNPTGVAGGRVAAWGGNLSAGDDKIFIVEADEYDRSFLALAPTVAVVTSVEADHLDIYRDLADIRDAFATYVRGARFIVLCADDHGAATLPVPNTAEIIRYGMDSRDARLRATTLHTTPTGSTFTVEYDGDVLGTVELNVHGLHNVRNALAAIAVGIALGTTVPAMAPGLAAFTGVERRFQRIGEIGGITIVDDYAHHPTEIVATLQAARLAFPSRRIVAAFQPHLYTRTRDFATDFGAALAAADAIYLADLYPAREQPIMGVSSQLIANAVASANGRLAWQGPRAALAAILARDVQPGDVVLTIGAGDITETGPELMRVLESR
ncbi:MAG TPA: UDP-N-acetylmuramate--L-alanine ligase [Gemmatimonadaceae bacterium]|nr:UDP-N-acetylmuramate--L-alanine ligase [Gemmatimonadaceae bacterium]